MPLVEGYVRRLKAQLTEIQVAMESGNWEGVSQIAHQLKGTAGSYGFPILSQLASRLEHPAQQRAPGPARAVLDELFDVLRRIELGLTFG